MQVAGTNQPTLQWSQEKVLDIINRSSHTSTLIDNHIITIGGIGRGSLDVVSLQNEITAYSLAEEEVSKLSVTGIHFAPRKGHSACAYDHNKIIIFGGINSNGVMKEIGELTLNLTSSAAWEVKSGTKPPEGFQISLHRAYHIAHVYQNSMYLVGGKDKEEKPTNFTWRLDLNTWLWERLITYGEKPEPRWGHSSVLSEDNIYIYGGFSEINSKYFGDLWKLNLKNYEWQKIESYNTPAPRRNTSCVANGEKIYIFGGTVHQSGHSDELFSFSLRNNTWEKINTSKEPRLLRSSHTSVLFEDKIIIWGGQSHLGYLDDIFSLKIEESLIKFTTTIPNEIQNIIVAKGNSSPYFTQMTKLFNEKTFSDVIFVVQGVDIPAHKSILSARCKFFENMFTSGMKECTENKIEVLDIKPETFHSLLQFLYCNEVGLTETLAKDLLQTSDKYSLPELKMICEKFLISRIRLENFVEMSDISEIFDCQLLKDAVVEFAGKNLKSLEQKGYYAQISKNMLWNIILKLGVK